MSKGRRPARLTKGEKFSSLEKTVENMTMALRMNQLMLQALNKRIEGVANDLAATTHMLSDIQYRILAIQDVASLDMVKLQEKADLLRTRDFEMASAKADIEGNLTVVDTVESDDDTVILRSTTPDLPEDKGIFRSRIRIAEMNQPDLMAKLQGKKVGEVIETVLEGNKHIIELLGVRRSPPSVPAAEEKAS